MPRTIRRTVRSEIPWGKIEEGYRVGLSLTELERRFQISRPAITKRARSECWVVDIVGAVRAGVEAELVGKQEPTSEVPELPRAGGKSSGKRELTPAEVPADPAVAIREAVAERVAIVRVHRKDVSNGMQIVRMLAGQLEACALNREVIEDAIRVETEPGEGASDARVAAAERRRNAMLAAIALPTHAKVARDLAAATKDLVALERQAYAIDRGETPSERPPAVLNVQFAFAGQAPPMRVVNDGG